MMDLNFNNYIVMKSTSEGHKPYHYIWYGYGDPETEIDTELEGVICPEEEITAEDYAEILGSELENHNYHAWTSLGQWIIDAMKTSFTERDVRRDTMKAFLEIMERKEH